MTSTRVMLVPIASLLCLSLVSVPCRASATHWEVYMGGNTFTAVTIGAKSGFQDGYDGQTPYDVTGKIGIAMLQHRIHSYAWSGPTGWYWQDFESPIAPGESKTWSDIYLWSQNYTPPGNQDDTSVGASVYSPPVGYNGHLVLDYVPASLNWAGPTEFDIDLHTGRVIWLPVPTVTDPLDGVRMHITVTAPVPEPSALAALGFGLLPFGGAVLRRRLRCR